MKEINIAKTLVRKRREKGITQDELAEYIGVSKASVSKWETGQSYPDITFLPELATYFNISLDELMGYTPQMKKEDIRKLYQKLSAQFAEEPFEEVMAQCRSIIKKYYACFPLLMQMATLFMNHYMLAGCAEEKEAVLRETVQLCVRIKEESDDVGLLKEAVLTQAFCCLALNEPQSVLDLLGETARPVMPEEILVSQAYLSLGNMAKAKETLQVNLYQYLMLLSGTMVSYLQLCADDFEKAEECINRALALVDAYELEHLNPNTVIQLYGAAAYIYCANGFTQKAVEMLNKSVDIFTGKLFPFCPKGDAFFDALDGWLSEISLGQAPPRSEKVIKESMMQDVLRNPAFAVLEKEPGYKSAIRKLEKFTGGD